MATEKIFRTKTGYCHIQPDRIILTRDGISENFAEVSTNSRLSVMLVIYTSFAIALFYFAYETLNRGERVAPILYLLVGIYLLYGVISSFNHSSATSIPRNRIVRVDFKKGVPGMTRSRFEVIFQDKDGRSRKRLIMLPGSLSGGSGEAEKALDMMRSEGFGPISPSV